MLFALTFEEADEAALRCFGARTAVAASACVTTGWLDEAAAGDGEDAADFEAHDAFKTDADDVTDCLSC